MSSSGTNTPEDKSDMDRDLVDRRLLELLVCPVSKGELIYDAPRQELISRVARLAYPIRDGVPIMLAEEARHLDDNDPALKRAPAGS